MVLVPSAELGMIRHTNDGKYCRSSEARGAAYLQSERVSTVGLQPYRGLVAQLNFSYNKCGPNGLHVS